MGSGGLALQTSVGSAGGSLGHTQLTQSEGTAPQTPLTSNLGPWEVPKDSCRERESTVI